MSETEASDYLQKNVKGILQPMINSVLADKPKEPVNISSNK